MLRIDLVGCGNAALPGLTHVIRARMGPLTQANLICLTEFDLDTVKMLMNIFVSPPSLSESDTQHSAVICRVRCGWWL